MGKYDSEHKMVDISDFSQSSILFFPHMYRNYHDSSIVVQSYQRNAFQYRANYMGIFGIPSLLKDGPLRSLLPISLIKSLQTHIHQNHGLTKSSKQVENQKEAGNVVVVHTDMGILLFDRQKGSNVSSRIPK